MTGEAGAEWRILLVEDDEELARTTSEALQRRSVSSKGERAMVEVVKSFGDALAQVESRRYDLVVLDIRDEEAVDESQNDVYGDDDVTPADKGLELYSQIRERRFVPIIFYSAVAHLAQSQHDPPFVTVVSKLDQQEDNLLRAKVTEVFDSPLPRLNRALAQHVDGVLRGFMIDFVEQNWKDLSDPERSADLAYLLARRLAHSLGDGRIANLSDDTFPDVTDGKVHPTRLYVMPPIGDPTTGDIFCTVEGDWFLLLTPACDLVAHAGKRKAEFVVMARCLPLTGTDEYREWHAGGRPDSANNRKTSKLDRLIGNNRRGQQDRFYFLPSAWGRPDLIVDLQRLNHFLFDELKKFERLATLDDPYAQSLVAQLGRYIGRMGTPDLDVAAVRSRLPVQEPERIAVGAVPVEERVDGGSSEVVEVGEGLGSDGGPRSPHGTSEAPEAQVAELVAVGAVPVEEPVDGGSSEVVEVGEGLGSDGGPRSPHETSEAPEAP
jgi:CheY-like chemotaxis protein